MTLDDTFTACDDVVSREVEGDARRQDGYVLQFGDAARFLIAPCGESIVVEPDTATPASTLRHLLLDQVLPLALSARGHVVLHAAAVRVGERAVGFLGHTGVGKSTLAARTAQMAKGMVLSDDCLRIDVSEEGALAIPSYPGSRLWPDAIAAGNLSGTPSAPVAEDSEKRRVVVGTGTAWWATRLRCLYLLEQDSTTEISIEPCGGGDAVLGLVEHAYRLDPTDRDRTAEEFRRLATLASACAVRRLRYPRAFSQLPAVVAALLRDLP